MKQRNISFSLMIYDSSEELPESDFILLTRAVQAREQAYAPYSGFKVGAAVLLENNDIVIGNNQENASYPSGLCAERVAVFQAGALYPGIPIKAVAISASSLTHEVRRPAAPCGNCRQAMYEYEQRYQLPVRVIMSGATGEVYICTSIADMLPLGFDKSFL